MARSINRSSSSRQLIPLASRCNYTPDIEPPLAEKHHIRVKLSLFLDNPEILFFQFPLLRVFFLIVGKARIWEKLDGKGS